MASPQLTKRPKQDRCAAQQAGRRLLFVATVLASMAGCVSFQAPDLTPEELRTAIRAGQLIQPGDRVSVVTSALGERKLIVAEVDVDVIRGTLAGEQSADGDELVVLIDEVVSVRMRKVDVGRSVVGAGAWWLGAGIVAALVFSFSVP